MRQFLSTHPQFTAKELESYLNNSKATTRNIIDELLQHHQIARIGNGRATKYIVQK